MMPRIEWDRLLAPEIEWQRAYRSVGSEAKRVLDALPFAATLTTAELVEALYPQQYARDKAGLDARQRIFRALAAMATRDLARYASRGEPRQLKKLKKVVRPWIWHGDVGSANVEADPDHKLAITIMGLFREEGLADVIDEALSRKIIAFIRKGLTQ